MSLITSRSKKAARTGLIVAGLLVTFASWAQSYSINWHKIAGGGGSSSNGQYAVSGTVGQQDASGSMTGGNYSLTGGFWSLIAVQTPGAPFLTITVTAPSTVVISWPLSATGFTLQTTTNVAATNSWAAYGGTVTSNSATITPPAGNEFFRLFKP